MTEKIKGTEVTAQIKVVVTEEDINDLLVTATYGGITYWCGDLKVSEWKDGAESIMDNINMGGVVTFCDCESDDEWDLDKEKLCEGIRKIIEDTEYDCPLKYDWDNSCIRLDLCGIDADIADSIVQFALFGRVIFA